mgnify:CR=1 FL=1
MCKKSKETCFFCGIINLGDVMENLEKELEKAVGNVEIEGQDISEQEKNIVLRIYNRYKERLGKDAVESVLYALVMELENMEKQDVQQK